MITFRCDCGKELKVKDEHAGRKIKCPECAEVVRVPASSIQDKSRSAPATKKPVKREEEFEEEPRPRPRSRADDDEEDVDERPRRRRPRDDDDEDEEDERPRRKKKQTSGNPGLLIGLIAGAVLLLAGGGVGLYFLLRPKANDANPVVKGNDNNPIKAPNGAPPIENPLAKMQLTNNLKQLALAMHSHNDVYRRLPSPGFSMDPKLANTKPLLSWRVAVLPYIEQDNLYRQFKLDEPWDGPNNSKLLSMMPKIFEALGTQPKKVGHTHLQFATGPGTLFPTMTTTAAIPRSFLDGTSNTIVIVEAGEAVPWTKPADLTIDVSNIEQGTIPKLGALSPRGFFVAMGDASVRFVERQRISEKTIRQAFNPTDGMAFGPDW